jgi:hypothetical protein
LAGHCGYAFYFLVNGFKFMVKLIKGFENYQIDINGGVLNIKRGKFLKQETTRNGYKRVQLWSGGKQKKALVHRLVAEAFIQNNEKKETVNHIDGNKSNNFYKNLEWSTRSENQLHAYKIGLQKGKCVSRPISEEHKKKLCGSRWKKEKHFYFIEGQIYEGAKIVCEKYKISKQTVLNRCKSKTKRFKNWNKKVVYEK